MIMTVSDTKVLLWSAMANMDAEALSLLTQNKRFSSANTETWLYSHIREQIQVCQNIDLKCAFSHLFKKRTHTIFLAEMKQLMSSPASTYSDFSTAFWPEASRTVIDNLVAEAVKSDTKEKPQMALMLHAFLDYGKVNLYPGLVKSRQGDGPYFDIVDALPDLATQQAYLMDAVVEQSKSQKIVYKTDLSPLLCNIPLETLAAHKHSDALLKHLYQGTRDRRVLKLINDNQFRGQALEDQLGM
jgi:hypothetical protein